MSLTNRACAVNLFICTISTALAACSQPSSVNQHQNTTHGNKFNDWFIRNMSHSNFFYTTCSYVDEFQQQNSVLFIDSGSFYYAFFYDKESKTILQTLTFRIDDNGITMGGTWGGPGTGAVFSDFISRNIPILRKQMKFHQLDDGVNFLADNSMYSCEPPNQHLK